MNEKGKRNHFRGDIWLEKQIDQRVRDALHEQELAFAKAHIKDTDAQLLEYVRQWANTYGHTPNRGEIIGGSQREDNYELLKKRLQELNLNEEDYGFYMDLRKYGSTRHAGFGLGFERCVMYLTGVSNIRDVIPFPRTVNNCEL